MSKIHLSFRDWPYQCYINQPVKCAWSDCDFFAYALGSTIVILANDNGEYSPIFMWSPFDSEIECIEWMNSSYSTSINMPILALASNSGRLLFFNIATASSVTSLSFKNERILCLKFSQIRPNYLYIGFESGVLIHAKISLDKSQHYEAVQTFTFKHPINFISFDILFEHSVAVASENGNFSIIRGEKVVADYYLGEKINSFEFYPENHNFILISASSRTVLFAIAEMMVINFLAQPNVLNTYMAGDRAILVERDRLSFYRLGQKTEWQQISEVAVSSLRIEGTIFMNNKIMMMTSPLELYQIEIIRDKLFVTKHCSLLNTKPVDWSFYKGSIAYSTIGGYLHITVPTIESCPQIVKNLKKKKDLNADEKESEVNNNDNNPTTSSNNISNAINTTSYKIGNSCNFLYSYEISNYPMRVKWISDSLLIMWSQSHRRILTVDLINKEVKDLVPFKFLKDNYTLITQVIVSPDKSHMCIVINNQTAILISCSDLNVVSLIPLKEISIGTFYSDSSMLIFVSNSSTLYLYDMQGKLSSTRAFSFDSNPLDSEITTISCSESGSLYIGDMKGSVYKFTKKYYNLKRIFMNSSESILLTDGGDVNQNTSNNNSNGDNETPLFDISNIFNFGAKNPSSTPGSPNNSNPPNSRSSNPNTSNINNNNNNNNNNSGNGKNNSSHSYAIASISSCGKLLLVIDRAGRAYSFLEESTGGPQKLITLPFLIESFKYASDSLILVKFSKHKKISCFSLKGKYAKRRVPAWYRNMMLNEELKATVPPKTAEDFATIGISLPNLLMLYNRKSCYRSTKVLINILSGSTKMSDTLYSLALMTGSFSICKRILKRTSSKAPNFLWRVSTLAFFDLDKPGDSMKDSIQILKESGHYSLCYELLMVTKASKALLDLMIERKDYKDAYYYIRNQSTKINSLENCEESIINLGNLLLETRHSIAPIIIMAQLGMFNDICVYITRLPFDNSLKNALIKFIHQTFIEIDHDD